MDKDVKKEYDKLIEQKILIEKLKLLKSQNRLDFMNITEKEFDIINKNYMSLRAEFEPIKKYFNISLSDYLFKCSLVLISTLKTWKYNYNLISEEHIDYDEMYFKGTINKYKYQISFNCEDEYYPVLDIILDHKIKLGDNLIINFFEETDDFKMHQPFSLIKGGTSAQFNDSTLGQKLKNVVWDIVEENKQKEYKQEIETINKKVEELNKRIEELSEKQENLMLKKLNQCFFDGLKDIEINK